jgi:hypothetical protein
MAQVRARQPAAGAGGRTGALAALFLVADGAWWMRAVGLFGSNAAGGLARRRCGCRRLHGDGARVQGAVICASRLGGCSRPRSQLSTRACASSTPIRMSPSVRRSRRPRSARPGAAGMGDRSGAGPRWGGAVGRGAAPGARWSRGGQGERQAQQALAARDEGGDLALRAGKQGHVVQPAQAPRGRGGGLALRAGRALRGTGPGTSRPSHSSPAARPAAAAGLPSSTTLTVMPAACSLTRRPSACASGAGSCSTCTPWAVSSRSSGSSSVPCTQAASSGA